MTATVCHMCSMVLLCWMGQSSSWCIMSILLTKLKKKSVWWITTHNYQTVFFPFFNLRASEQPPSFSVRTSDTWNTSPTELRNIWSIKAFSRSVKMLKMWLQDKQTCTCLYFCQHILTRCSGSCIYYFLSVLFVYCMTDWLLCIFVGLY